MENNIIIIFLAFFSVLTGLKPSCIRACIMYSFILLCENMYRKNNVKLSIILTLIGGLIPSRSASKKDPVEALRSE